MTLILINIRAMIEKKNLFSIVNMKVLVGVYLTLVGCGGFYTMHQTPLAAGSTTKVKKEAAQGLNYLSARIYFKGDQALSNPIFRESRDSKLSHLYIYALFNHPSLGGQKEIPLYLIDLEKGSLEVTEGVELISKLPLLPNQRGNQPMLSLKAVALEKSKLDIFRLIWLKAKPMLQTIAISTGAGAGVGVALDSLSSLMEELAAAKEFRYQKNLIPPTSFGEGVVGKVEMYLLAPTDKEGILQLALIDQLQKKDLVLKRDDQGGLPMVFDGTREYKDLPYLLIDYQLSNYVEIDDFIPQKLDGTCAVLSEQKLQSAQESLAHATLSAEQMELETRLLERAKAYSRVKANVSNWKSEGSTEEERQKKRREAVDAYVDYQQFFASQLSPKGDIYLSYFQDRVLSLDQCTELWAQKLPGYLTLQKVSHRLALLLNQMSHLDSEQAMEHVLQELHPILVLDQTLSKLPGIGEGMIRGSALYNRAAAAIANIEEEEFARFYRSSTNQLQTDAPSSEMDQLQAKLLTRLPLLQCELCKDKIVESIRMYQSKKKPKKGMDLEKEQVSSLYELGRWHNRLWATNYAEQLAGKLSKLIPNSERELEIFQKKLIHLSRAKEKNEVRDALDDVHQKAVEITNQNHL